MKISYRILFINFFIVVLIVGSASFAFYSIMYNVLTSQQSKFLLNSSNDFLFAFKETFQNTEDDFNNLSRAELYSLLSSEKLKSSKVDFILERNSQNPNYYSRASIKEGVNLKQRESSLEEFISNNPSAIIKSFSFPDGGSVFYGRLITDDFLNSIARKINAQVVTITGNSTFQVSNQSSNQKYIYILNKAFNYLSQQEKFSVFSEDYEEVDIVSTLCNVSPGMNENQNLHFLIFSTLNETADLRASIKYMLFTVGIAGVLLSLILTFVFTQKIRSQLSLLSQATELTRRGNYKNKIEIKSTDEIGYLAAAFNNMLDELEKHEHAITEYSDFIALINGNATLKEIADAALNKIIKTCGFAVGAIYTVKENSISLIRSYGISGKTEAENIDFFDSAIKSREMLELSFEENFPKVSSGIIRLEIKHMLIIPVIYNNDVIAIIELGGMDKPSAEVKDYLSKIQDQLAIGMNNAFALIQLENLVVELKLLNEEYQKQNEQIKQQNESFVGLHNELKEKAHELEIQKQRAEESTKLKSQFLASMSHELRTPMNSVLGLTELILEESGSLNSKTKERLEIVHRSGKRLMCLINDILDLSKIEAGKMDIKNDEVLLEDIVFDVETAIMPLVNKKRLNFKIVRKTNTNIFINTDRGKVTQVLINLLGNAVKFTEKGFIEFEIKTYQGNKLRFEVRDSGIGIPDEDQKIIFEEFRQIDGTTTRKYSGTGLGLSICKRISEILDGSLSVESQLDNGSTFSFTIPLKISSDKKDARQVLASDMPGDSRTNPILLIDNDADVRTKIGEYLESRGTRVVHASNGFDGIEAAKQHHPYVISMNLLLPGKDSWKIVKGLREDFSTAHIPIVLYSFNSEKNLGYGFNIFDYLMKPITHNDFLTTLKKLQNYTGKKVEKIIAITDDDSEYRQLKTALQNEQISMQFCNNASYMVNQIADLKPDLILLDLIVKDVDGISLAYELKNYKDTRNIPVIINIEDELTEEDQHVLQSAVEDITLKSKSHPLDVLKIVRDRIKIEELSNYLKDSKSKLSSGESALNNIREKSNTGTIENGQAEKTGNVMIVDDDPDALFTLNEIVQSCNCNTLVAKNGIECLNILEEKIPDLILLDIMMPEMDGFQTIKKIRENLNWMQIPVFAVTARAMQEDRQIILKNGFDDYITKPVNTGVISFKIEKLFSKIRVR